MAPLSRVVPAWRRLLRRAACRPQPLPSTPGTPVGGITWGHGTHLGSAEDAGLVDGAVLAGEGEGAAVDRLDEAVVGGDAGR